MNSLRDTYNRDLIKVIREKGSIQSITSIASKKLLLNFLINKYNGFNWSDNYIEMLKKEIIKFCLTSSRKWSTVRRHYKIFENKNSEWLSSVFIMPVNNKTNSKPSGRPPVDNFILCSERTQRRKIQSLLSSSCITSPEVLSAAKSKLYKKGQRSAASLFKDSSSSPNRAKKIKSAYKDANKNCPVPYTPDEALAFMIDNKLTKQQYINIRLGSKKRNCDIYPSYENIILEKNNCYPSNIDITESYCKIPLQSLLDHTTNRILKISSICNKNLNAELEMVYKWGCDGSSGQSQYKQKFNDSSTSTDQTMFMFSLVPLELRCFPIRNNDSDIIWQNPVPSSTKFCRPIKFMYKKETTESTQKEVKDIEEQINNVCNTDVLHNDQVVQVKHTLIFSMVDGKVIFMCF